MINVDNLVTQFVLDYLESLTEPQLLDFDEAMRGILYKKLSDYTKKCLELGSENTLDCLRRHGEFMKDIDSRLTALENSRCTCKDHVLRIEEPLLSGGTLHQIADTKEKFLRDGLIKQGWTPPADEEAREKNAIEKLSARIHRVYCDYYKNRNGTEYWTSGDYNKLDEATKEADRYMARFIIDNFVKAHRKETRNE